MPVLIKTSEDISSISEVTTSVDELILNILFFKKGILQRNFLLFFDGENKNQFLKINGEKKRQYVYTNINIPI